MVSHIRPTISYPIAASKGQAHYTLFAPTRRSCAKHLERQIVHAWKTITRATRKHERASFLPQDFVFVTSRRRSVMFA